AASYLSARRPSPSPLPLRDALPIFIPTRSFGPRPELPSGWPSQPFGCWILVAEDPAPVPHHCRSSDAAPDPGPRRRGSSSRKARSEEHTSELQSRENLVCRLLLEKT